MSACYQRVGSAALRRGALERSAECRYSVAASYRAPRRVMKALLAYYEAVWAYRQQAARVRCHGRGIDIYLGHHSRAAPRNHP